MDIRHYLISGRVQGVGYRAFVAREGKVLGLKGWVRNLRDGRVEVLALVPSHADFERLLKKGPSHALVEHVESEIVEVPNVWEDLTVVSDGEVPWSQKSSVSS